MGKKRWDAMAAMTVLNRRTELGDDWRGGAMSQVRSKRGGERGGGGGLPTGGRRPDRARPTAAQSRRLRATRSVSGKGMPRALTCGPWLVVWR
jgi:hypothetical protein